MGPIEASVSELLAPTINAMGYELWGIEYKSQGRHSHLRVYIDSPKGIGVSDCEQVSHQISGILDVEDPITGQYTLEISSPGMDRPLFHLYQYEKFAGRRIKLRLRYAIEGQRNIRGTILGVENNAIKLGVDEGNNLLIQYGEIEKANLEPEI